MDESSVVVTTADGQKLFNPNSTASDILRVLAPGGVALRRTTDGRHYVGSNSVPEGDYELVLPPPTPPPGAYLLSKICCHRQAKARGALGSAAGRIDGG
jgi:hypothetical protein